MSKRKGDQNDEGPGRGRSKSDKGIRSGGRATLLMRPQSEVMSGIDTSNTNFR